MKIQSPDQVKINSIVLTSEKIRRPLILAGSSVASTIVAELNIFENITRPYLTGYIIIQDDLNIYQNIKFDGTEKITVSYSYPEEEDFEITKTFIAANVSSITKLNDNTSMLNINLIEDIGFFDKVQLFSKYYDGTGEQIIEKIVLDRLNREIDKTYLTNSYQSAFRYIVPYLTPMTAIRKILYKMTTNTGLPFFFYSTVNSDKLILTDMESVYRKPVFNRSPFVFSQATSHFTEDLLTRSFTLYELDGHNLENTLKLAQNGGIGSLFTSINVTTGAKETRHIDMLDQFQRIARENILPPAYSQDFLFNKTFVPDPSGRTPDKLGRYNSRVVNTVSVSSTFPYDNLNNFYEEDTETDHQLRAVRDGFIQNLMKNRYVIYLPGILFLKKSLSNTVGNQINIRVYRTSLPDGSPDVNEKNIDDKRSGNYIILSKRHIFDIPGETHNVSMEISRLSNQENTQ